MTRDLTDAEIYRLDFERHDAHKSAPCYYGDHSWCMDCGCGCHAPDERPRS